MATSSYIGATIGAATTAPAGASGSVQYNNSGSLGGFGEWDGSLLTVPGSVSVNSSGLFKIPLGVPQNVIATPGTDGSLAAGTYYFRVTAIETSDNLGETTGSVEVSAVIAPGDDGTGSVDLTWDDVTNRDQFRVYVGTSPGAENLVDPSPVTGDPEYTLTDLGTLDSGSVPTTNTASAVQATDAGLLGGGTTLVASGGGGQQVGFLVLSGNRDPNAGYAVVVSEDNNIYPAGLHPYNGASMSLGFDFTNGAWNSAFLGRLWIDNSGNINSKPGEDGTEASGSDATSLSLVGGNGGAGDGMGNVSGNGANVNITAGVAGSASGGATAGTDGVIALNSHAVLANGLSLRGDSTDAHTYKFQVYDVNGTAYRDWMTATNGDAPDVTFTPPTTGTLVMQATTYKSSDGSSGVTAGPFTTITGITVKNGLVTALTGS